MWMPTERPAREFRPEVLLAHREWAERTARALVRGDAAADDLQQQAWLEVLERPPAREPERPRGWLRAVLRFTARDMARAEGRRRRHEEAAARPERVDADPAAVVERAEVLDRVIHAVFGLGEPGRSTVLLRYFEGLEPAAIARLQGVPAATVRTRLKRALDRLREDLDARHGGDRRRWAVLLLPLARDPGGGRSAATVAMGEGVLMTARAKAGAVGAALVALGLLGWFAAGGGPTPPGGPPEPPAGSAAAGRPAAPAPSAEGPAPAAPAPAVPPPATEHVLRGRVLDAGGLPVPGAPVLVAGTEDPFGGKGGVAVSTAAREGEETRGIRGPVILADGEGRFEARFEGPRRVFVAVPPGRVPGIRAAGEGRWVDTPAGGVELRALRVPTCTVVVRLVDASEGRAVAGFGAAFTGKGCGYLQVGAKGDVLEQAVELAPGAAAETVVVAIRSPATLSREVLLPAGGRLEVAFDWRPGGEARGRVLAPDGSPLEGALVYVGDQVDARGDEPFKPFDAKRVPRAVRTDAAGQFSARGDGSSLTAWHPRFTPVTVPLGECAEVRLPARGGIRGRLLDAGGAPLPSVEVVLDRVAKAVADAEGRFSFEGVEAGARGLLLPGRRMVAVRVEPGETAEVEIGPGLPEVRLEVRSGGKPLGEPLRGALCGLDRLASVHDLRVAGGACTVPGVLPGRFVLFTTAGHAALLEIRGASAVVDLGPATLAVAAPAGTSLCLAPGDPDDLVDLLALRVGHRPVPASGTLAFPGLADGAYRLLVESPPGSGHRVDARTVTVREGRDVVLDLGR